MTSLWDTVFEDGGIHQKPSSDVMSLVPLLQSKGVKKILDAGCGNGRDTISLAEQGFDVTAIDSSETAINAAKNSSRNLPIDYRVCDLTTLPFNDNSFDFVLAGHSIEYTGDEIEEVIAELTRVLKKGKPLYVKVLSQNHPFFGKLQKELYGHSMLGYAITNEIPVKYFSEDELKRAFSDFEIEKLEHIEHAPSRTTGVALHEWVLLGYKQ